MRTFKSIGEGKCIVCDSSSQGECILLPIDGTDNNGICEASPVHLDCLSLRHTHGFIYQRLIN